MPVYRGGLHPHEPVIAMFDRLCPACGEPMTAEHDHEEPG
jgi:hypothetical protein